MDEEVIMMTCITPTEKMDLHCSIEDIRLVMIDGLRLMNYIPPLMKLLKERRTDTLNIDIQEVFKVLDDPVFWKRVATLANGFNTFLNIRMVKAGLFLYARRKLKIHLLKEYYHCYCLLDNKNGRQGAKRDVETLFDAFCLIDRFMPKNLISRWLEYNEMHLRKKDHIMGDEFLFLAVNSYSKKALVRQKISRPAFSLKKNPFNGTFPIDAIPYPSHPELNLNKIVEIGISSADVLFDIDNPVEHFHVEAVKPKKPEKTDDLNRVKSMMRSPRMFERMKSSLQERQPVLQKFRGNTHLRPTTARVCKQTKRSDGMSRVSTAVSLKTRAEPFHVMTLREAAILTYNPKPNYKRPVSRHIYFT